MSLRDRLQAIGALTSPEEKARQKKFLYTTESSAAILERGLSDIAILNGTTVSDVIEKLIAEKVLPENRDAARYVAAVLYGKARVMLFDEYAPYNIKLALEDIFALEAEGSGWNARHSCNRKLVEYAASLARKYGCTIDPKYYEEGYAGENPTSHMLDAFKYVCEKIEQHAESIEDKDFNEYVEWSRSAKSARQREVWMREYGSQTGMADVLSVLLQNWEVIGNYTFTFRFLTSAMKAMTGWQDSPEDRINFKEACQEVMSGWEKEDEEERR